MIHIVNIHRILDDLATHWPLYLSLPFLAAATGYVTKRVAIEMMFRPVEFAGIRRIRLGWQGVVPRNAERTARIAAEMLTTKLVDVREIFARIDPYPLSREIEGPLLAAVDKITREVLAEHHPELWQALPSLAKDLIVKQVQGGVPDMVRTLVHELRDNVHDVIDVEEIAVSVLRTDRALLVRLIRDLVEPEMAFIARSGVYFGFTLGVVQTIVFALTKEPIVLPLSGMAIGWLTDWLAIRLVFLPRRRTMLLGIPVQGVFQRRRHEFARQYGELIATRVMTVPNIVHAMLHGPRSARLVPMVHRAVHEVVDDRTDIVRPVVTVAIGPARLQAMKDAAAAKAMDYLPGAILHVRGYLSQALDIGNTIATRMRGLSRMEYEDLLRPVFRQDEPKLIAAGALIGLLIGEAQVLMLLG